MNMSDPSTSAEPNDQTEQSLRRSTRARNLVNYNLNSREYAALDDDFALELAINESLQSTDLVPQLPPKRRRGRPPKNHQVSDTDAYEPVATPQKRSRASGVATTASGSSHSHAAQTQRQNDSSDDDLVVVSIGRSTASPSTSIRAMGGRFTKPNKKKKIAVDLHETVIIGDAFGSFNVNDAVNAKTTASLADPLISESLARSESFMYEDMSSQPLGNPSQSTTQLDDRAKSLSRCLFGYTCPSLAYTDASEWPVRVVFSQSTAAVPGPAADSATAAAVAGGVDTDSTGDATTGSASAAVVDGMRGEATGTSADSVALGGDSVALGGDASVGTRTLAPEESMDPLLADAGDCVIVAVIKSKTPRGVKVEEPATTGATTATTISTLTPTSSGHANGLRRSNTGTGLSSRGAVARSQSFLAISDDDDDLVVVGTKEKDYDPGVDWPHPRYVCVRHPYSKENGTMRYMACKQCYCHICGCVWRSCPTWNTHCSARDCAMDNAAKSKMKRAKETIFARNQGDPQWEAMSEKEKMEMVYVYYLNMPSEKNKTLAGWLVKKPAG